MSVLAVPDVETSRLIGRAAVEVMYSVAASAPSGAVFEANFHRSISRSGIQALPGQIIEVFCRCNREVALARYRSERSSATGSLRRTPHGRRLWNEEVTSPVAGDWTVIEVNTGHPVDISVVVKELRDSPGGHTGACPRTPGLGATLRHDWDTNK